MRRKSKVLEKFKEFEAGVTNERGKTIRTLGTDNEGSMYQIFLPTTSNRKEFVMS